MWHQQTLGFDFAAPLALEPVKFLADQGYRMTDKLGDNLVLVTG